MPKRCHTGAGTEKPTSKYILQIENNSLREKKKMFLIL